MEPAVGIDASVATPEQSPAPVLALVGTLVPDTPAFHGPAFNRAAQMFQDELVRGLTDAGLPPTVFGIEPIPAFPRGRRLLVRGKSVVTRAGRQVRLLPFINVQPFKALSAGLVCLLVLTRWAWRHRGRPRAIHCINLTMPPGVFILLAARLTRSRTIVSLLDVWKPGSLVPDTLYWRLDFWLQTKLIPRFDGLMVVSQAIVDDLAPGRRVCRLEGGVAPDRFRSAPAVRLAPRPGSPFRLVLSGSLDTFNGVELTLDAMKLLPAHFELVIAGSGPLAAEVARRAAADPRITYCGFIQFEAVLEVYWSADLLLNARLTKILDTRYFFPSKLMELLASGTPVLSTYTGQVEEEYGHIAYLLRDETAEGLAARILSIAAIPFEERQALGERARTFMFAEKTWRRQTARLARYIRTEVFATT